VEWDEQRQLYKYNPLLHWTFDEMTGYIKTNNVPYNPLHDKGFVSIGCAPCTRAIEPGEDVRAGRWWWELSKKECGLHSIKQS
jgi:phosphoadenosine phosphosulfate reductase